MIYKEACPVLWVHLQDCNLDIQKAHSQRLIHTHHIDLGDLNPQTKLLARDCEVVILLIGKETKLLKSRH